MRVRVKVCGITRAEDARLACELGADALGFNFVAGSPRRIDPERARAIIQELPPFVTPVAVVVNPDPRELTRLLEASGARAVQFHGEEAPGACAGCPAPWYKAFRVGEDFDPAEVERYRAPWCLLDAHVPGLRGGTGRTFDWSAAAAVRGRRRVILAGGLGPGTLADAVAKARPDAVDLNSGVEASAGIKDPDRLRAAFKIIASAIPSADQSSAKAGRQNLGRAILMADEDGRTQE